MKKLGTRLVVKAIAFLLALGTGVGGFWATLFILSQWDTLWTGVGYYSSNACSQYMSNCMVPVEELARLLQYQAWEAPLSYLDQQRLSDLEYALDSERTNFCFTIRRNDSGALVYSNLEDGQTVESSVHTVLRDSIDVTYNDGGERRKDYFVWNGEKQFYLLYVVLDNGTEQLLTPTDAALAAQYGYTFNGNSWDYNQAQDSRLLYMDLAIEYGVAYPLSVHDEFWDSSQDFSEYARYLPALAVLTVVLDVSCVLTCVFLCRVVGRRPGREDIVPSRFDRIPLDLLVLLELWIIILLLTGGDPMAVALNSNGPSTDVVVGLALVSSGVGLCLLSSLLTLTTRIRTKTLWTNTLVWRLIQVLGRAIRNAAHSWPLTGRVIVLFLLYLVGTYLTALTIVLVPVYQGLVLWLLCRWAIQWHRVRQGADHILGADPSFKIDTRGLYHDLAQHAKQLNDLGGTISQAVDERIRSERFRAELITNVSHDLKTPLTSIINYVDLLKKQPIDNPQVQSYIEVLTRKSQRLKKLTEDLVEASKASTGTLPVHLERLGMVQLVQQALGEFEERFAQSNLAVVTLYPEEEVWIMADGHHLWRVIDNLLSNCNKYALEGTRVYLEITRRDNSAVFSVKNISRQQLNIPPEQLMERFVRGDTSRTTDGSGLGLSIARSLTELQHGQFDLSIDGDLFKATVTFQLAPPPEGEAEPQLPPPA